jgi:hypothetical protein
MASTLAPASTTRRLERGLNTNGGDERRDALEIGSGPTATCSQLHVARTPHGSAGSATPSTRLRTLDEAQVGSERFGNLRKRGACRAHDAALYTADLRLGHPSLFGQLCFSRSSVTWQAIP